ncbi:MAG: cation transporter, partial [Bacteroidetes bacterium]
MTRNNRIWVLLLLCLGIRSGAQAQDLESLLVTADSANLELQGLYLEYQAALEVAPQVSQLPEPEAGLGLFVLPVETRLGPQWVRLSISQMFPWKGTRQARSNVALAMAAPRYEKIAAARLNLHYQIKTAYYQLYELDKKQQIIKDRIQLFKSLEALATTNLETGTTSMADVLRLQVRIREL